MSFWLKSQQRKLFYFKELSGVFKDFGMNALGMSWLLVKGNIIAEQNRENDASCVLHQRNTAGSKGRILFLSWHFQHVFASKDPGRPQTSLSGSQSSFWLT